MSEPHVVAARPEHHADFARLFAELGVHDPVPPPERWWAVMAPSSLFLELDGRAVAYGYAQALSSTGYVRHVAVDPAQRRRGFGRAMMRALAQGLRERGCTHWELNVKSDNEPAIALYRSLGMQDEYLAWVVRLQRAHVGRLPAPEVDTTVTALDARDDHDAERRFSVAPGLLAQSRSRPGVQVLAAHRARALCGLAVFDPSYPGCFPFSAQSSGIARVLCEHVLREVPPEKPWLQLVVERDRALAEALLATRATLVFEMLHMTGPLPA